MNNHSRRHSIIVTAIIFTLFSSGAISLKAQSLYRDTSRYATALIRIFSQVVKYPVPKTWGNKVAFRHELPGLFLIEFIPKGQTLQTWTDMLTIRGFRNLAKVPKLSLDSMLELQRRELKNIAPDKFYFRGLFRGKINGYDAGIRLMGLKEVPAEKSPSKINFGEIGIYMILVGKNDVYNIHRSWRTVKPFTDDNLPMSQDEILEWTKIFQSVELIND